MSRARVLTLVPRKRTLAVSLGLVLAAAFIHAGNVKAPARLVQYPSDSPGSPMLVVTAPYVLQDASENAARRVEARRRASTATAWTSARGA
ncbi:MAG: hypothetical protein ABIR98_00585 [Usitatibacter sp.]